MWMTSHFYNVGPVASIKHDIIFP